MITKMNDMVENQPDEIWLVDQRSRPESHGWLSLAMIP
jgi:hypothetical protein